MANNIFSKFAQKLHPKTNRIDDAKVKEFVYQFKLLQEYAESMAKTARKIKRTLKTSKDISDIEKIRNAAKNLFDKTDSIFTDHSEISNILLGIAESLELEKTSANLRALFTSMEKTSETAASEYPIQK